MAPGTPSCLVSTETGSDGGPVRAFPLERTKVRASLDGPVASVTVAQRFGNPYAETIEAAYVFPLPDDAAVSDFVLRIGERSIRGIVRERAEAEQLYREARNAGYVASLLTEERPNIFTERVANIEPGRSIEVELTYYNMLAYADGWYEWRFPLVVGPRFNPPHSTQGVAAVPVGGTAGAGQATAVEYLAPGERTGHEVEIEVSIDAGVEIRDIAVPSHAVDPIERQGRAARVRLAASDGLPNRDFLLRYRVAGEAPATGLVSSLDRDGKGTFALTIYPPGELRGGPRVPLDIVFVIDRSGSMGGRPLESVKEAVSTALDSLGPTDRFQIVDFGSSGTSMGGTMLPADRQNVARARRYIGGLQADGGTMVLEGLRTALALPQEEGRTRYLVFLSDGFVGNEAEIIGALHRELGHGRVFAMGIGSSANWHLLHGMARAGRGAVADIGLSADAGQAMERFMGAVTAPVMHDLAIEWSGVKVSEVWPPAMPDLVAGRPVTVLGRYRGAVAPQATLTGWVGDRRVRVPLEVRLAQGEGVPNLDRLWARAKIAQLSDDATWKPADADVLARSITETALRYGISSPYTAFVAVDAARVTEGGPERRTVVQPVPVPAGVSYEATVAPGPGDGAR